MHPNHTYTDVLELHHHVQWKHIQRILQIDSLKEDAIVPVLYRMGEVPHVPVFTRYFINL